MVEHEHRARKRFGQNFLHDQSIVRKIIDVIQPGADDHLVEIGPGKGALTGPLLEYVPHLDVIEIDRDLVRLLDETFNREATRITVHQQDALQFDFSLLQHDDLRIVGNLPYNISTPLLFHLIEQADVIHDMTFMLQKEVVERMAAGPNSKQYGRLSVMLQYACQVTPLFTVKPGAFKPAPRVDSAVVSIKPLRQQRQPVQDLSLFSNIVRDAFSQRRKTLRNALKHYLTGEQLQTLDISPSARAENLAIDDFIRLANGIHEGITAAS